MDAKKTCPPPSPRPLRVAAYMLQVHAGGKRLRHEFRALYDYYGRRVDHGDGEFPSCWPTDIAQARALQTFETHEQHTAVFTRPDCPLSRQETTQHSGKTVQVTPFTSAPHILAMVFATNWQGLHISASSSMPSCRKHTLFALLYQDDENGWQLRVSPEREAIEERGDWARYSGDNGGAYSGEELYYNAATGEKLICLQRLSLAIV